MSEELKRLYQKVVREHYREPRNFHELSPSTHCGVGSNPLCGDKISLSLNQNADREIEQLAFQGEGCAIAISSASLLTEAVQGKSFEQAMELFHAFHELLEQEETPKEDPKLGELNVFLGLCAFPARKKCATLAWHALEAAISQTDEAASTE